MQVPDLALGPRAAAPARREEAGRRDDDGEDFRSVLAAAPEPGGETPREAGAETPVVAQPSPGAMATAPTPPEGAAAPVPDPIAAVAAPAPDGAAAAIPPDLAAPAPVAAPVREGTGSAAIPATQPARGSVVAEPAPGAREAKGEAKQQPDGRAPAAPEPDAPKADARGPAILAPVQPAAAAAPPPEESAQPSRPPRAARPLSPTALPALTATPAPVAGAHAAAPQAGPAVELVVRDEVPASWRLAPVAAHAADAPAPPQPTSSVAGQIALAIGRANDRHVEIRLDPPELGRVQIHLNPTDGGLQAVVLAERPETQDLLRRHAEALARDLGAAGYDNVSLDFAPGGQSAPGRDQPPEPSHAVAVAPVASEPAAAPARRAAAGSLDIRL